MINKKKTEALSNKVNSLDEENLIAFIESLQDKINETIDTTTLETESLKKVKRILKDLTNTLRTQIGMEKTLKDLDLFQLLDLKHKLIFAKSLADELNTALKAQDHEYAALVCEKNGHKFTKPKEVIKIVKDENPYFTPYNGTIPYIETPKSFLEKRCTRCGLTETVEMVSKNKTLTL